MVAFVTYPESYTITAGAATGQASAPLSNLAWDEPNLIYRSTTLTPNFSVLSASPTNIDTIALIGTNLRATDTVRIRVGTTQALADGSTPVTYTFAAWSGSKSPLAKPMVVLRLDTPVAGKYVRVDITATGHPDGYVQISRLVIGSSCTNDFGAIGQDAERTINDASESYAHRGIQSFDKAAKSVTFKAAFNWISEADYDGKWDAMLTNAGNSSAVLMLPRYELIGVVPSFRQNEATFGTISKSNPKWSPPSWWNIELQVTSLTL